MCRRKEFNKRVMSGYQSIIYTNIGEKSENHETEVQIMHQNPLLAQQNPTTDLDQSEMYETIFSNPIVHHRMTEKSSGLFECIIDGCQKSYTGISGLNNHIKKKHSGASVYPCDECFQIFNGTQLRTMHKLKEHDGRRYQTIKQNKLKKNLKSIKLCSSLESTTIQCQKCNEIFNQRTDLLRHMKNRHTGTGEYPCPECSTVFYTMSMFNEHRNFHNNNIPKYNCTVCNKQFLTERKLKEHSIIHKERVVYKCNFCAKVFLRSQTLQYHRTICKAAFSCDQCVDSFMTNDALEKHKALHKVEQFTCKKCNKVFPNQQSLLNHEKRHSLRMNYTCPICKESVSTRANFEKHLKNHLETNLKCSVCDASFQSLVKYGYHKAEMHQIMKPYNCILCSDNFCTRHELFIHLHNHTDHKDDKILTNFYICEKCGEKSSMKEIHEKHLQSHLIGILDNSSHNEIFLEENQHVLPLVNNVNDDHFSEVLEFSCDLCDKIFQFQSLLTYHRSTDHELKKFPCTIGFCDQIYSTLDDLKSHIEQHEFDEKLVETQLNELSCKVNGCKRTFEFPSKLKRHMLSHILKEYKCVKCDRIYYSIRIYEKHLKYCSTSLDHLIANDEELTGPIECVECRQLFENQSVLKYHNTICKT